MYWNRNHMPDGISLHATIELAEQFFEKEINYYRPLDSAVVDGPKLIECSSEIEAYINKKGSIRCHRNSVEEWWREVNMVKDPKPLRNYLIEKCIIGNYDISYSFKEMHFDRIPIEDGEELDWENFEVKEVRDDEIVIYLGGDWQKGAEVTYKFDKETQWFVYVSHKAYA